MRFEEMIKESNDGEVLNEFMFWLGERYGLAIKDIISSLPNTSMMWGELQIFAWERYRAILNVSWDEENWEGLVQNEHLNILYSNQEDGCLDPETNMNNVMVWFLSNYSATFEGV